MAPTEGGLETGGMEYLQHGGKRASRNATEREFITDILDCASKWLENKKGKRNGNEYYQETYLEYVKLLFLADCCVVKAKYRSMRKTEAPHSLRIVFDSGQVGTEAATQC